MAREIKVVVPPDQADQFIERLKATDGVVSLARHAGASLEPEGDILAVQATTSGTRAVLDELSVLPASHRSSISISEPTGLVSASGVRELRREGQEATWEEVEVMLRRESNLSVNILVLMALSGAVAAIGLWTNHVHIVIGAMVLAPGFEPILRVPFGLLVRAPDVAWQGLLSTAAGYLALTLSAAAMTLLLQALEGAQELRDNSWIAFWSTLTTTDVLLSAVAGAGGAVTVIAHRAVLTAGVMIALSLIPAAAILGMGLAAGESGLAVEGLGRWAFDVGAVALMATLVLGVKQAFVHRRRVLS